jgi:iron complex outermembrane receptor protein
LKEIIMRDRRQSTFSAALASAVSLLALAVAAPASAQTNDDEVIVVTGVRSQTRSLLESPAPVDSFSAETLRETGAVGDELGQALATVAPSFNFPRQSNSGSSDHVRAGQLRGLSPDQTLVLVNGRRRHTSAIVNSETKIGRGTAAVDFNTIPLSAIKRVEALRDGAGAQYGSDAIAGVVNVLLDDSTESRFSVSYGAHVTDLEPVNQEITDGETLTFDASTGFAFDGDGFLRIGFDAINRNATNRAGFDQIPFFVDQTPANLALQGLRNYSEGDPDTRALNVWLNTEIDLGAATFYMFGTAGKRETRNGSAFYRYPDGSSNVLAIYPNGFRPRSRGDNEDMSVSGGLRWDGAGWAWDAGLSYGRNDFEYGVVNSVNPSLGAVSPREFFSGGYEFDQTLATLTAQRDFTPGLFSGPLTFAAGLEYRRETHQTRAGDEASFIAGPVDADIGAQAGPGITPDDVADLDRDVYSLWFDASGDLTEKLFVNFAARYEDYSDFDGEAAAKLSGIYRFTDGFALRAAVSNSIRAPSLTQVGFSDTSTNFGDNRALVRTRTVRVGDPIATALGVRALDPETSVNSSLGATFDAGKLFTLTVDAFRVDVSDRITLSERFFGDALETFVQGLPGGQGVQSVRFFANAIDTETQGVDVVAIHSAPLLGGTLDLSAAYSYAETEISAFKATPAQLLALDPTFRIVGVEEINTVEEAAPRSKAVISAAWSNDRIGGLARVSYFDEAVRVFNFGGGFEPRQEYSPEWQLDLEGSVNVTENVKFALGSVNVRDEYPDLSSADINFFGNLPYDILSPIGVNGRFVYARLSARF